MKSILYIHFAVIYIYAHGESASSQLRKKSIVSVHGQCLSAALCIHIIGTDTDTGQIARHIRVPAYTTSYRFIEIE